MSCWVAPSLAAELWGTTIDHVMQQMRDGAVPTRNELGMDLVDVAPASAKAPPAARPAKPASPVGRPRPSRSRDAAGCESELDTFGDWRAARVATARLRKPPVLH